MVHTQPLCLHSLSTRCQAAPAVCCTSAVLICGAQTNNTISHLFLLELPPSLILCLMSHEGSDTTLWIVTCSATGISFHYWVSYMRCHVFFGSTLVSWNSGRQLHLPGHYMTDGLSHTAERPGHNNGHSMTLRVTKPDGYRTWKPLRTLGLFLWFWGIFGLYYTNHKLSTVRSAVSRQVKVRR